MDQILQLVLNNGGAKGVGAAEMDQILQLVPNNGGSKGSEGSKWIKFSNWC